MEKKVRWTYGELLMKKWAVSQRLLGTFVAEGLCELAKVKPFGFHAIRHLTASILHRKGYELAAIQLILRHQSPSTTERYLRRIGMERMREVLEDLSRSKKGEVVEFKHWPQKIALPGLPE